MSSTAKTASAVQRVLLNLPIPVTEEKIYKAKLALESDFKPISDMRASRKYRMEVAKNLIEKFFLEIKHKKKISVYE